MEQSEGYMGTFCDSNVQYVNHGGITETQIFIKQEEEDVCDSGSGENVYSLPEEEHYTEPYPEEALLHSEFYGGAEGLPQGDSISDPLQWKYQCEFCQKRFRFFCRLKRHLACHNKPPKPPNPKFDESIVVIEEPSTNKDSFGDDAGESESEEEDEDPKKQRRRKELTCDLCGKRFTQKNNLHRHKLVHLGTKPFQCEECGLRFTEKSALDRHQVVHVGGGEVFKCTECDKAFNRKCNLERHVLIHSGGRRFGCPRCGKSFSQRAHLRRHEETHVGTKTIECAECGKKFNRRGNLNVHLLVHRGIKPYECKECGKKFSQNGHLKVHILTLHKKKDVDS